MMHRMIRALQLVGRKGALSRAFTWPVFSLASYSIVCRLKNGGIQPKTVIDIGANVGQFSVAASRLFEGAVVYPVEPDPAVAVRLKANVGPVTAENVRVTAIGDFIGNAEFHVNRDSQVSSMLPLGADRIASFPGSVVVEKVEVPITTLDDLFIKTQLSTPILLKIDVQGFEDRVIRGGRQTLKQVRWVLMEVSFSDLYQGEKNFLAVEKLMAENHFRFVRPVDFHVSPKTDQIIEMDALFEAEPERE